MSDTNVALGQFADAARQRGEPAPVSRFNSHHGTEATREVRWLTPKAIPEALGRFDLDPCGAPDWSLAERTYLLEDGQDGLVLPWEGRVWLNPPYGRQAEPFLERLAAHGRGTALVFARTETAMFHRLVWPKASAVMFLRGRVTFHRADGVKASANAGAPSVLVAYGHEDAAALWKAEMTAQARGESMGHVLNNVMGVYR